MNIAGAINDDYSLPIHKFAYIDERYFMKVTG